MTSAASFLFRHALDIREHYERKLERANNLYMELSAVMLQLELKEKELQRYEYIHGHILDLEVYICIILTFLVHFVIWYFSPRREQSLDKKYPGLFKHHSSRQSSSSNSMDKLIKKRNVPQKLPSGKRCDTSFQCFVLFCFGVFSKKFDALYIKIVDYSC